MPKRAGGIRKKRRTHNKFASEEQDSYNSNGVNTTRFFVIKRGLINSSCKRLVMDWRRVMAPHCALKLKESSRNCLKDFTNVAGVFGVTHLVVFSQTNQASYMRFIKLPEGPTITFKIHQYTLIEDVRNQQVKPRSSSHDFLTSPLLILNGFREKNATDLENNDESTEFSVKLLKTFIGSMFPAIDLQHNSSATPQKYRRAILFHRDRNSDTISIRHYCISRRPAGLSKGVKQLVQSRRNPAKTLDLMKLRDVSDIILGPAAGDRHSDDGAVSDSSDIEPTQVTAVEQQSGKETLSKLAISLHEIGPRLEVTLVKIEDGVANGKVLYHRYITKSKEELEQLEQKELEFQAQRKRQREIEEQMESKRPAVSDDP